MIETSAYNLALRFGRRAFFEQATNTIRSCPENYCLAHQVEGRWEVFPLEGATKPYRAVITTAINQWSGDAGLPASDLADGIGDAIPAAMPRHAP